MRVLVAGANGQVARALQDLSGPEFEVMALGRPALDVADGASVQKALDDARPDVVVNAAAYTAVDRAESEEAAAFAVNRDGPQHLAEATARAGVPLVHISTDYVFPGMQAGPHKETDPTGPQGAYGRSKLAGERALAASQPNHAILRTAWVYAPYGTNFLLTMLRLASEREVVRVVADQRGTPTYAPDIAEAIRTVAEQLVARPSDAALRGTFHVVSEGEASWAEFAAEIFARSAERGGPHARVEPITTADYPTPARRPANSLLDTARFRAAFGHNLPDWRSGVARCLDALAANLA